MGFFQGLKDQLLLQKLKYSATQQLPTTDAIIVKNASVAVAGVDLVVSHENDQLNAHIVEVNNNPAMPSPQKHNMTAKYREHLVQLSASICALAFRHCS